MPAHRKPYAFIAAAAVLLIVLAVFTQQGVTSYVQATEQTKTQSSFNSIVLNDNAESFNRYNTNGTPSVLTADSATFYGSNRTNMYSDMVSYSTLEANKSLVLEAKITANVTSFSIGEDQFAVFATDDIVKYKSDEFGFVLPEMGNIWYAYIQSPQINGFFVWVPLVSANPTEPHNFKVVYSNDGSSRSVDFYVDGKLFWSTMYPDISGKDFHMVLTSHKVSGENVDLSQNQMDVRNAVFSDKVESNQNLAYQNPVL